MSFEESFEDWCQEIDISEGGGLPGKDDYVISRKRRIWNAFRYQLVTDSHKFRCVKMLATGVKEAWFKLVEIVCAEIAALLCRKAFYCEMSAREVDYAVRIYHFEYGAKEEIEDLQEEDAQYFYLGEGYSKETH